MQTGPAVGVVQRGKVAVGQVQHMDVVAHAGAVRRGVVVAEHGELVAPAHCHLGKEGHEVVGRALRVFAEQAARVGAHRVEVAQRGQRHCRVGCGQVGQHVLHHQLAAAVGTGCGGRCVLAQWHAIRGAVDCGRGAEHQRAHAGFAHGLEQHETALHIVVVVGQRLLHRLAHGLEAGEMDDGLDAFIAQQCRDEGGVTHVTTQPARACTCHALDVVDDSQLGVGKVVEDKRPVAGRDQLCTAMAADVAGTAGDEDVHCALPCFKASGGER